MNNGRIYTVARAAAASLVAVVLTLGVWAGSASAADAADAPVTFGYQAWPGVTVKSQVAIQLLQAMGYPADVQNLSSAFVYQGLKSGDVDVSLGAWMPAHKGMVQPLIDAGQAIKLAVNLKGAIQGLAVPGYVWDEGIHSIQDLSEHGDMFDRKIYGIAPGAAMSIRFEKAINDDYKGLGEWQLMTSSTAGMLSQVDRATANKQPIVFHGWRPHWMNIAYDIRFLKDGENSPLAEIKSTVYTIVRKDWPQKRPQVAQFLKQFLVEPETQSRWINQLSQKGVPEDEIARTWVADNLDVVAQWLDGVKTADGGSGIEAVRAKFAG